MLKLCFVFLFLMFALSSVADNYMERYRVTPNFSKKRIPKESHGWWDASHMTGNWSDPGSTLAKAGITLSSHFITDLLGNPVGGKARGFAYAGSYGFSARIDFSKVGLSGFEIFNSVVWRTGTNLSQRKIDNQFNVAEVFGSQTIKLNELYFIQHLFDDRFEFKTGRLNPGNDFLASPIYFRYVNNGFNGNPVAPLLNVPITAYPNATWGAYLMFKPSKRLSAKFAVYNANSNIKKNKYHGANFTFKSTNGVIWITEWHAMINQEENDRGMPGNYKLGFFYLTGDEPKFTGGKQSGDPCFYLLFDQMIYRQKGSDQGLTSFLTLIFQPQNRNLFPFFTTSGLLYKGLIPGRAHDVVSLGYIYGKYSSDQAKVQRESGKEAQNFESVVELNYWIQANRWLSIVPDMQYIIHPKGRNTPNALVIGVQIGIDLF